MGQLSRREPMSMVSQFFRAPQRAPHAAAHNWYAHAVLDEAVREFAAAYARGVLVDIGCGSKPYEPLCAPFVQEHIGVDHLAGDSVDIVASAYQTGMPDASADTVLMSEVLEHLEEPAAALREVARVLRPGGHLMLTVPFLWHIHERPRDFYRYTEFGLRHLLNADFEVLELRALSGFVGTFAQLSCYVTRGRRPKIAVRAMHEVLQRLAWAWRERDVRTDYTCNYAVAARRRG